jgi:hypothetical protein
VKKLMVSMAAVLLLPAGAKVGSERWCEGIKKKPKGDLSANEASDYTKHCIFKKSEG